ncbi:MAG TPA: UDP-galactopyranose mutase [Gemmatimonadaceae bacterium]|nr:UDP-galactopyranose mutase [Gemmatimonadaceae bacterium]
MEAPWQGRRGVAVSTGLSSDSYDTLIVGAGYAGSVMAERLASQLEQRVLVIDRRDHIAGNAHDYYDEHGVLVHKYGPHIFHTNSQKVVDYLSAFTEWRPYEHRVLARVDNQLVPMPINRTTINSLYGLSLTTDEEVSDFLAERAEPIDYIRTSEDVVVAKVGRELYEKFFRGYTRKQWQRDPSELNSSVCARIPIRTNEDDRYFTDAFQKMPLDGYTAMFERMLDHPLIDVQLRTDYDEVKDELEYDHLVYTGPIDAFFGYEFGALPYRSLEFELKNEPTPDGGYLLPATSVNEPSEDVPYTRTTEYRWMTGQERHDSSTVAIEYPRAEGDPYYPIPRDDTRALYRQYEALAAQLPDVTFVGRLARYQYLNMDQVVGQALSAFEKLAPAVALAS